MYKTLRYCMDEVDPVEDPVTELKKLAGRVLEFEKIVSELCDAAQTWRYESKSGEQLRAEIGLYERAMDRCAQILTMLAKLQLDERLVYIEEAKAALVEQLVLNVFRDLQLSDAQVIEGRRSLARNLSAITG